jgi:hypothetical protein
VFYIASTFSSYPKPKKKSSGQQQFNVNRGCNESRLREKTAWGFQRKDHAVYTGYMKILPGKNYGSLSGTWQLVLPMDYSVFIPNDDSVRLLRYILGLFYEDEGRKSESWIQCADSGRGEYVVGAEILQCANDQPALKPLVKTMKERRESNPKAVTTDAWYESEENYVHEPARAGTRRK